MLAACWALDDWLTAFHVARCVSACSPMGWSSWNPYHAGVMGLDETTIRAQADAMVSSGMAAAGYSYINIDDFWANHSRAANGSMIPSHSFPSGMKNLADYVHSKGLRFGLYTDVGTTTCGGQPGAWGHECADAQTFADWGIVRRSSAEHFCIRCAASETKRGVVAL